MVFLCPNIIKINYFPLQFLPRNLIHNLNKMLNQLNKNKMNAKLKSLTLALGFAFATTCVRAQSDYQTLIDTPSYAANLIVEPNTNSLKVYIGNFQKQPLELILKNGDGNELFKRNFSKKQQNGYLKLDMSELPNDFYTVEVSDYKTTSTKAFRKGTEVVVNKAFVSLIALN